MRFDGKSREVSNINHVENVVKTDKNSKPGNVLGALQSSRRETYDRARHAQMVNSTRYAQCENVDFLDGGLSQNGPNTKELGRDVPLPAAPHGSTGVQLNRARGFRPGKH